MAIPLQHRHWARRLRPNFPAILSDTGAISKRSALCLERLAALVGDGAGVGGPDDHGMEVGLGELLRRLSKHTRDKGQVMRRGRTVERGHLK